MIFSGAYGLYEGAVASEERWQRRRSEARRAFLAYKRAFPDSTYEDYVSFADDISGGNSFIRGAIPANDVLKRLAEREAEQRAQTQLQENLRMLSQRAQIAGQIDALVNDQVLYNDDDARLLDGIAGQLGYDPNDPATHSIRTLIENSYPNGFAAARDQRRSALQGEILPEVQERIAANPNLTDDDLVRMYPRLGEVPSPLAREIMSTGRQQAQQALERQTQQQVNEIVSQGRSQITAHGTYTIPAGTTAEVAEQARAALDPIKDAEDEKISRGQLNDAVSAMQAEAELIVNTPTLAAFYAGNEADLRERLRTAALRSGVEPGAALESEINYKIQSIKANAAAQENAQSARDVETNNSVVSAFTGNEALMAQLVDGTMSLVDLRSQVDEEMRALHGDRYAYGHTTYAMDNIQERLATMRQSQRTAASASAVETATASRDAAATTGKATAVNTIDAIFDPERDAMENSVMRNFVELLGAASGGQITPEAALHLNAKYLNEDFLKSHDGDLNAMMNEALSDPFLVDAMSPDRVTPESVGFPEGNQGASSATFLGHVEEEAGTIVTETVEAANSALAALQAGEVDPDNPNSDASTYFLDSMELLEEALQSEILALAQELSKAVPTSKHWSTDGEITSDVQARVIGDLRSKIEETRRALAEVRQRGERLIIAGSPTAEDEGVGARVKGRLFEGPRARGPQDMLSFEGPEVIEEPDPPGARGRYQRRQERGQ